MAQILSITSNNASNIGPNNGEPNAEMMLGDYLLQWNGSDKPIQLGNEAFLQTIKAGYKHDPLFSLILDKPLDYPGFSIQDDVIWTRNLRGDQVACFPQDHDIITQLIDQAHNRLGHFGGQ